MQTKTGLNPGEIFIKRIQNALLHHAISGWRRRSRTLLDINCGDGSFLRHLWHSGFDVTGTEPSYENRQEAAKKLGEHAEIYAASETHLPFDDNQFDWVVIHLGKTPRDQLEKALEEAARVAGHGLAVTFWNTASPVLLLHGQKTNLGGYSWLRVRQTLRRLQPGSVTTFSTLLFAFDFFRKPLPKLFFNSWKTHLPLGAWTTIKLDMTPQSAVTPLLLPTNLRKINSFEPVLEYCGKKEILYPAHKNPKHHPSSFTTDVKKKSRD
ncbi:MAG: class I SAM-dependent methyltransferase [Desulfovibrio sp.]|nr:class I SAM-dependent methyltransferase [Desulfovibrio sp.]